MSSAAENRRKSAAAPGSAPRAEARPQTMEAIGHVIGAVVHDFNNLFGLIIGNLELLREPQTSQAEAEELSLNALTAAFRGVELTRGLLAFAGRQPLRPRLVDINELIVETTRTLRRTLGERIEIVHQLSADVAPIVADPVYLAAALVNLADNAREAMANGGRLTIATANRRTEDAAEAIGDGIVIAVSDTGPGMPPEILGRVFEPYFAFRDRGRGSGLALSAVQGYVTQSGGQITAQSEPGAGTTFRLYLPRGVALDADASQAAPRRSSKRDA
jgi:signal transduction histidine kinase